MERKFSTAALAEIILPGLVGIILLLIIPVQVNLSQSLLTQSTSPQLFPKLTAWALIAITAFRLFYFWLKQKGRADRDTARPVKANGRLYAGIAIMILYAALIPVLGFIIATFLNIVALMYLINRRTHWLKALIYSAASALLIWFVFDRLITIPLPVGFLGI